MECFTDNETGFWAQVRTGGLGAIKVNLMTAAPHGVRRARIVGADARPIQALTFLFPRSLRMAAGRGVGALTSEFLVQLARNLEHYRPAEAARLATAALQILATRLAHELDGDRWIAPTPTSRRS